MSDRELQAVLTVGSGETIRDAAVRLLLTPPTVERNLESALSKQRTSWVTSWVGC